MKKKERKKERKKFSLCFCTERKRRFKMLVICSANKRLCNASKPHQSENAQNESCTTPLEQSLRRQRSLRKFCFKKKKKRQAFCTFFSFLLLFSFILSFGFFFFCVCVFPLFVCLLTKSKNFQFCLPQPVRVAKRNKKKIFFSFSLFSRSRRDRAVILFESNFPCRISYKSIKK